MTSINEKKIQEFDPVRIRKEFPVLNAKVHGKALVYLDNAATNQKPERVIERIRRYYEAENSNVHRGVHRLSQDATDHYEASREVVRSFINAASLEEVIFTSGTTAAINLVASSYGRKNLEAGDEIIISGMEHHSNIVPWQMICEEKQAKLKVIPVLDDGTLDMDAYEKMLSQKVKLVSVVHASNALGTVNPVKEIIDKAHALNIPVMLDGAQSIAHREIDVQALDCDFFCFSGHKVFGPTGIGLLYGKASILNEMPPFMGGGDMIKTVTFEKTTYNDLPFKFEAGTPHISGVIGLAEALNFVKDEGVQQMENYEQSLLEYATEAFSQIDGLRIIGTAPDKTPVISFLLDKIHPYDTGVILDNMGIAIRTGHHCTQPLMDRFKIQGTARASFSVYNTKEEVDLLIEGILRVKKMFA